MKYTQNYNLRKPEDTDPADIQDLNYNADEIDGKLKEIEDWEAAHLQASNPHSITPALIGAETPQGAQARVDVVAGRVDALEQDYTEHKSDYELHKDTVKLKVAKLEQEVKRYKELYEQSNPTQSPRVSSDGYGVVGLPKNAGQGPMDVRMEGLSYKNELNYDITTMSNWVVGTGVVKTANKIRYTTNGSKISQRAYIATNLKPNTNYVLILNILENTSTIAHTLSFENYTIEKSTTIAFAGQVGTIKFIFTTKASFGFNRVSLNVGHSNPNVGQVVSISDIRIIELPAGSQIETDANTYTADELALKYPYVQGGEPRHTSGTFRVRSVGNYEPYISSEQYVNSEELRSLPNGVADSIENGKLIKRIGNENASLLTWQYHASSTNTNYWSVRTNTITVGANAVNQLAWTNYEGAGIANFTTYTNADNLAYYVDANGLIYIKIPKSEITGDIDDAKAKEWLANRNVSLIYLLATPIETPVQVSGSVQSYPNGTVYIEPAIADAGVYDGEFAILNTDFPIAELESVQKIDFQTGLSTELDVGQAVIAGGGLSFTHTGLSDGDIVFVTYLYDDTIYTAGKATCEYYDSRFVLKDDVTGKFYRKVETVEDGELVTQLVEV